MTVIAKVIAASVMLHQVVAPASSPPQNDEWLAIRGHVSAEMVHITARFICDSTTVEVSYLRAKLDGGNPMAGFYVERVFVNDKPIAIRDLQRINSAVDGREIVGITQPYCESGGSAWVPSARAEAPRLGKNEHALDIYVHASSKNGEIMRETISIRFKGLVVEKIDSHTPR